MADIRKARGEDFLAVAELDRSAWHDNRNSEYIPDGEHVWRIWCEHAITFVAVSKNKIIGVAVAFPCTSGAYFIHKVLVAPPFRSQSIGTRLMQKLLQEIDRIGVIASLTVDPVNKRAIALYNKMGFTESRFAADYYRKHEDRYIMTRKRNSS